jgi:molybdopterin molybdotransferase
MSLPDRLIDKIRIAATESYEEYSEGFAEFKSEELFKTAYLHGYNCAYNIYDVAEEKIDGMIKDGEHPIKDVPIKSLSVEDGAEKLLSKNKDNISNLTSLLKTAVKECDMVLFSGGSSAGILDFSASAIEAIGGTVLIHGIAVKPGKPTIIGSFQGKALVALPGHPVSAYFVARQIIKHIYYALSGEKEQPQPYVNAALALNIPSNHGRTEYVPIRLEKQENGYIAHSVGFKSGLITLLARTDGYLTIDRDTEGLHAGSHVLVYLL